MGAIGYLYQKTFVNRVKIAMHKPVTYVYLLLVLFYFTAVPASLRMIVEDFGGDSPQGMVMILTVLAFWSIPGNLTAYTKRKGLVYRNCDVHFLFPAPVRPKKVLLYAHLKTLTAQILMNSFIVVCGGMIFAVEKWRLAVYFLFSVVVENVLEGGIMILLYGDERMGEKQRALLVKAAYGLMAVLVLLAVAAYFRGGLSMGTVAEYLQSDLLQMVPVVGWYISVLHLLFLETTAVNVAGTVCYGLLLIIVVIMAWRMKCTGAFYEDATKFAEDYEDVLVSRRQGNTARRLGKVQKFGKAHITWHGYGARALFYRQLLEYKKSRFFIFDISTFMAILGGAAIAYLYIREGGFGELESYRFFVIPVIASYLIFVFNAVNGKWAKELSSPYTYLIPDTAFRKLVNATAMQHIQSVVNGCLITLPGAVAMGMPPGITALCIVCYIVLSANKLYALAVAEAAVGNTLGTVGKQLLQMLIHGLAITSAVLGAVMGMVSGGILWAFLLMDVFLILFTGVFMVIAVLNFYNMETGEY